MDHQALELFSSYMKVTGVPALEHPLANEASLQGKKLGVVNGATWITLWSNYFGRAGKFKT